MRYVKSLGICLVTLGVLLPAMSQPVLAGELEGEIESGLQWLVDEDRPNAAKFEEYQEVPNGFVVERFRLNWEPSAHYYFTLDAVDVNQDDQQIAFGVGGLDRWSLDIGWSENHRLFSDSSRQIHTHVGGGVYTITDPDTSVVPFEDFVWNNAHATFSGYQRETGSFAFEVSPIDELTIGLSAARERREGTLPTIGAGYAFGGVGGYEFAFPIDYQTDTATGFIEYAAELFTVGARYTWSDFDTQFDRLFWENPLRELPTVSSENQLDTGDDSKMTQWHVYVAGNLPGRTRITASASRGSIENEDALLPITVDPSLAAGIDPADRLAGLGLDGEYDTALYDLRLSGRPNRWFNWKAWWRQYELERDGREYEIEYIAADDHVGELRRTLNFGYERGNLGALLGFSPNDYIDLGLQFDREEWDRENSPVHDTDEDSWKLFVDVALLGRGNLRASYERRERNADHYDWHYLEHESFPHGEDPGAVNIGSRRHIWADRDRDVASLSFEVMPTDIFSIYGEAQWYDSEYMDPNTGQDIGTLWLHSEERRDDIAGAELYSLLLAGRSEDEGTSYTLGFAIQPSDRFRIFVDFTHEEYEYTLWSRYRGRTGSLNNGQGAFGDDIVGVDTSLEAQWYDWRTINEDTYRTFNVGFQGTLPNDKWDIYGNILYHEGESQFDQEVVVNPFAEDFNPFPPNVETEMILAKIAFDYHAREDLSFGVGYWYEKWEEDDWQSDFNDVFMGGSTQDPGNSDGNFSTFLGTDFSDYENHILTVTIRYLF